MHFPPTRSLGKCWVKTDFLTSFIPQDLYLGKENS